MPDTHIRREPLIDSDTNNFNSQFDWLMTVNEQCRADGLVSPPRSTRLAWLIDANQRIAQHERLFRHPREEQQMLLMRRPLSTRQAYGRFGLLLGAFPPAAIFFRLFGGYGFAYAFALQWDSFLFWFQICLAMNAVCCLIGYRVGAALSDMLIQCERDSWNRMWLKTIILGACWGLAAGWIGGAVFFLIGAFFGAACAVPVGLIGFALFTPLHRLLARGGMIDARHFWPLACGVTLFIVALIFSPRLFPY